MHVNVYIFIYIHSYDCIHMQHKRLRLIKDALLPLSLPLKKHFFLINETAAWGCGCGLEAAAAGT